MITNKDDLTKENARTKQLLKRMDMRKALLAESSRELLKSQLVPVTITKASHRYLRRRD